MNRHRVRTGVVVAFVTVLVWIYAENESRRVAEVTGIIRLQSDASSARVAWFEPSESLTSDIRVMFDGTAAGLESMRTILSADLSLLIGPDIPSEQGEHTINLLDVLRRHRQLSQREVVVQDVSPLTIRVRVDELQRLPARVELDLPEGMSVDLPSAEPATATIVLPGSYTRLIEGARVVSAVVPRSQIRTTPGVIQAFASVPLQPPDSLSGRLHVRIDPPTASVSLRIREQAQTITLPSAPIYIRAPQITLDEWSISIDGPDFLTNVRVTGSADAVARIESGQTPVFAYVTVLPDDALAGSVVKNAVFSDFSTAIKFESDNTEVKLTFTRRGERDQAGAEEQPGAAEGGPSEQPDDQ